jgi:Cu+-exporting ATPase
LSAEKTITAKDPVCGMILDPSKAHATEEMDGWAYLFCSAQCHRMFLQAPERYAKAPKPAPRVPPDNGGASR